MAKFIYNIVGAGNVDRQFAGMSLLIDRLSQTGRFLDQHLSSLLKSK